jgi:hypothetical protein
VGLRLRLWNANSLELAAPHRKAAGRPDGSKVLIALAYDPCLAMPFSIEAERASLLKNLHTPTRHGRRPRHCVDAFVLDGKLQLQALSLISRIGRPAFSGPLDFRTHQFLWVGCGKVLALLRRGLFLCGHIRIHAARFAGKDAVAPMLSLPHVQVFRWSHHQQINSAGA